jgi:protein-tyrosine phosphatase
MTTLDSISSPLRIDALHLGGTLGWIGMTICPGKCRPNSISGNWQRDLALDLQVVKTWGASVVITLLENHEFAEVGVSALPDSVRALGIAWLHLSIPDRHAPGDIFKHAWPTVSPDLHARLDRGEKLLIHCMGGIGRTGTVAALLLIERGIPCGEAISLVRGARHGAIETQEQEIYLQSLRGDQS